jgi:hypothetical protein
MLARLHGIGIVLRAASRRTRRRAFTAERDLCAGLDSEWIFLLAQRQRVRPPTDNRDSVAIVTLLFQTRDYESITK